MKKNVWIISVFCLLAGCLGLVDTNLNVPVTKVDKKNLIGKWKADKFSYEFKFKEKEKDVDSIKLTLFKNGTFVLKNGIATSNHHDRIPRGKFRYSQKDFRGTWELTKGTQKGYRDQYVILFHSKKNMKDELPIYYAHNARLYNNKGNYRFFLYIGDPDSGNRLGFTRAVPDSILQDDKHLENSN